MTVNVSHGAARRTPTGFRSATGCKIPRCKAARTFKITQRVRCAASKDFRPDSKGATDATAPVQVAPPESHARASHNINPFFYSLFIHLRDSVSLLSQHLGHSEPASILPSLHLGEGPFAWSRLLESIKTVSLEHEHTDDTHNGSLQVPPSRVPLATPTAHDIHAHFWTGANLLRHMKFGGQPDGQGASGEVRDARADAAEPTPSSPAPPPPPARTLPGVPLQLSSRPLLPGPDGLRTVLIARLALLWHAAMTWQQHAAVAALWRLGHAVGAADRARRNMPPPRDVPHLVIWGAAAAVVHAEESVALALAHTATAASAVAASVPSAAAAAATPVIPAPHLPLLYHARRRLLAAAKTFLERLRSLQSGCTTHVLLRFLLFSALNPQLRRDMLMHLDILARRATQLAILQAQHETWAAKNPAAAAAAAAAVADGFRRGSGDSKTGFFVLPAIPPVPALPWKLSSGLSGVKLFRKWHPVQGRSSGGSSDGTGRSHGLGSGASAPDPPAAAVGASFTSSSGAESAHLSARWFGTVFTVEMQACARQLRCDAAGSPPDDRAGGGPPGRFDLRDLYRLIRVVEVAVEDLERYP